ncbi:MAG: cbb3-type cytochrome oxidase assembly protein CcoS [Gemmatimonadota bacterium]|nr:cbb3-type cytochrome oxidase assembly protein CcoS [Gemmatimonadota bacterium]
MSVIYVLVPVALAVVALALWGYVWAAKRGQFDDLKTPGMRVLHEDDDGWTDPQGREDRNQDDR